MERRHHLDARTVPASLCRGASPRRATVNRAAMPGMLVGAMLQWRFILFGWVASELSGCAARGDVGTGRGCATRAVQGRRAGKKSRSDAAGSAARGKGVDRGSAHAMWQGRPGKDLKGMRRGERGGPGGTEGGRSATRRVALSQRGNQCTQTGDWRGRVCRQGSPGGSGRTRENKTRAERNWVPRGAPGEGGTTPGSGTWDCGGLPMGAAQHETARSTANARCGGRGMKGPACARRLGGWDERGETRLGGVGTNEMRSGGGGGLP